MTNIEKVLIFEDYANSKPIVPKKKTLSISSKKFEIFCHVWLHESMPFPMKS